MATKLSNTIKTTSIEVSDDRDLSNHQKAEPIDRQESKHQFVNDLAFYDHSRSFIPGQVRTDNRSGRLPDPYIIPMDLGDMLVAFKNWMTTRKSRVYRP